MDEFVRVLVWIALFGGTGAAILMLLPRIVVWSLEIIESVQTRRSRAKSLLGGAPQTRDSAAHPSKSA